MGGSLELLCVVETQRHYRVVLTVSITILPRLMIFQQVLGPAMEKAPSVGLGLVSLVAFAAGTYCIHETNILHTVSPDSIQPLYVAGALLVPISWGLHVASWIQKENGM